MTGVRHVYLAGPMRGIPEFNFPAFFDAAARLREWGFEVFLPAERYVEHGFDWTGLSGDEDLATRGFDLGEALAADLEYVCRRADAVFVLPGWEKSRGVAAELAAAMALGKPIYVYKDARWNKLFKLPAAYRVDEWTSPSANRPARGVGAVPTLTLSLSAQHLLRLIELQRDEVSP